MEVQKGCGFPGCCFAVFKIPAKVLFRNDFVNSSDVLPWLCIVWICPNQDASHHQDYEPFLVRNPMNYIEL